LSLLLGHTQESVTPVCSEEILEDIISSDEQATSVACTEMVGSSTVTVEPSKELNLQHHNSNTDEDLYTFLFKEHQLDLPDSLKLNSAEVTGLDDGWEYDWSSLLSDVMDPLNVSLL